MSAHEHCNCHHEHDHDCHHDHDGHDHPISRYDEAFSKFDLHLHDEQIAAAAQRLIAEKQGEYDTDEVRRQLLGTIELTTLKVTDSQESVLRLVEKVNAFADAATVFFAISNYYLVAFFLFATVFFLPLRVRALFLVL